MRIGIIFHSVTGHTRDVATRLLETFRARVLDAELFEIKAHGDDPDDINVTILEKPDLSRYDRIIFAAPVHMFNLSRVMRTYLGDIPPIPGKHVALFVTHHLPCAWMGGTQALSTMRRLLLKKNAQVTDRISINWSSSRRDELIRTTCETIFA